VGFNVRRGLHPEPFPLCWSRVKNFIAEIYAYGSRHSRIFSVNGGLLWPYTEWACIWKGSGRKRTNEKAKPRKPRSEIEVFTAREALRAVGAQSSQKRVHCGSASGASVSSKLGFNRFACGQLRSCRPWSLRRAMRGRRNKQMLCNRAARCRARNSRWGKTFGKPGTSAMLGRCQLVLEIDISSSTAHTLLFYSPVPKISQRYARLDV
jgi:hypothetical protein